MSAPSKIIQSQWNAYQANSGRSSGDFNKLSPFIDSFSKAAGAYDEVKAKLGPVKNNLPDSNQLSAIEASETMQSETMLIGQTMETFITQDAAAVRAGATLDQSKLRAKYDLMEKADGSLIGALQAILNDIQNYLSLTLSGSSG